MAAWWFVCAAALPVIAWHGVASKLASDFRLHPGYLLSAWTGFGLIALGLICFVPVLLSESCLKERSDAEVILCRRTTRPSSSPDRYSYYAACPCLPT